MSAPRMRLLEIDLFEREMPFLHPFRFGDVTVRSAPQAFVRVVAEVESVGVSEGVTAEMMMPRWFDRRPYRTPAGTIDDLRASLRAARHRYLSSSASDTAFGHHVRAAAPQGDASWPPLAANYGPAVIDKAILDALFKSLGLGVAEGFRRNVPGLDVRLTPDLGEGQVDAFLRAIDPAPSIALRWTVGLLDDPADLRDAVRRSGLGYLKIKLAGEPDADAERLLVLGAIADEAARPIAISLDANEQYDRPRLARLVAALESDPALITVRSRLLYLEQPFARDVSLDEPLGEIGTALAVIIDEADDAYDAFPRAMRLGYRGVSSKSCKGLYKALLNAVRARTANEASGRAKQFFVTGEDLTCQAGLAVQQDTALAAILGIAHVERNGHHYVDGFGPASQDEASRFAEAHPDFYRNDDGAWRLDVSDGRLSTASLVDRPGFASGASPDWNDMRSVETAQSLERETP